MCTIPSRTFNITDMKGSVLLSCADTFVLGLLQASDKLDKMIPRGAKLINSQVDRYDIQTANKKTQSKPPGDRLPQTQVIKQLCTPNKIL